MGASFGGDPYSSDELNQMYSQQPYQTGSESAYGSLLGALGGVGATAYGYFQGFCGMGQQQYNAQMGEYQTRLGTPVAPKPTRCDPSEIAWLKGRVKEIEWRP